MASARGLYTHGKDAVSGLTARQRDVVRMLGEGMTQMQIAEKLGVSRQRIRQIVESLLAKGIELPGVQAPKPGSWTEKQVQPTE